LTTILYSALVIWVAVAAYGVVHSWLASLQAKELARRLVGSAVDRYYRLGFNVFATLSLLPLLALPLVLPDHRLYVIRWPWVLGTTALQGIATLALLIGLLQTGLLTFLGLEQIFAWRISPQQPSEPSPLVTHGLYRYVRHPLYTAGLFFIWLTPVMTTNLVALFIGLSAYLVIGAYFEERKMVSEYGVVYVHYQQQTPMFFPKLRR
jgi:methanethiol S-methyltransferase